MSGHFEKGAWVDGKFNDVDAILSYVDTYVDSIRRQHEINTSLLKLHINILNDLKRDAEEYKKEMDEFEVRVNNATFMTRLKFLFTGKI